MSLFFQVHHVFRNNNCVHDIYTALDVTNLKYSPRIISTCNSDAYRVIQGAEEEDEFINTYEFNEYNKDSESSEYSQCVWMVFKFYENTINSMSVLNNYDDAINEFDLLRNESSMTPSYNEHSVLEKDTDGNAVYTLYVKCDGVYMLPDKAQRVVLQKINIFDEVTTV